MISKTLHVSQPRRVSSILDEYQTVSPVITRPDARPWTSNRRAPTWRPHAYTRRDNIRMRYPVRNRFLALSSLIIHLSSTSFLSVRSFYYYVSGQTDYSRVNVGYAEYFGPNWHCGRPGPSAAISFTFDVSCDCNNSGNSFRKAKNF